MSGAMLPVCAPKEWSPTSWTATLTSLRKPERAWPTNRAGGATTTSVLRLRRALFSVVTKFCVSLCMTLVSFQPHPTLRSRVITWTWAGEPLHFQLPPTKNLRSAAAADVDENDLAPRAATARTWLNIVVVIKSKQKGAGKGTVLRV